MPSAMLPGNANEDRTPRHRGVRSDTGLSRGTNHAPPALSAAGLSAIAIAVFAVTAARALLALPESEFDSVARAKQPHGEAASRTIAPDDQPHELVIPKLGIHARVQSVGVTVAGRMAAPSRFGDVGWYRYGPRPGQEGSAVIAGHVDNALGLSGVFKRLDELQPGDVIAVRTEGGAKLAFRVTAVKTVPFEAVPEEEIFNTEGEPRLVLITCAGKWLRDEQTYDQRLLIFATLR